MLAGMGWLASPDGQLLQERIWDELVSVYGSVPNAWTKVLTEEKALLTSPCTRKCSDTSRLYYCYPPRSTIKEFEWNGVMIPKGVTIYMNAQAINHGTTYYPLA
jgi:phenylacetate 2-hydroxylase